jgi:hypothetical protein
MASKTRDEYEKALDVLKNVAAKWDRPGSLHERRFFSAVRGTHFLMAYLDRSCAFDDAALIGAVMGRAAADSKGYLTCHTGGGVMTWSVQVSRDLDERDEQVEAAHG